MRDTDVASRLAEIFTDTLGRVPPAPDEDLIEGGFIDSLALVELLVTIERRFEIVIPPEALEVEAFRTLTSLASLVTSHVGGRAA